MVLQKTQKITSILVALTLFLQIGATLVVHAHDEGSQTASSDATVEKQITQKLKQGTYFLLGIKKRLANSEAQRELLKSNVYKLEDLVANNKTELLTIQDQLANLDSMIKKNERKAMAISVYIAELRNRSAVLEAQVKQQKSEISVTKGEVTHILRNLYLQASLLYIHESPEERIVSLFAYNNNLNELNQKRQYATYLNEATQQLVLRLEDEQSQVEKTQDELEQKQLIILELQNALSQEARILNDIHESRGRLLAETQGKQELYEDLLKNAQEEEINTNLEVSRLKENYSFFEQKIADFKANDALELNLGTLAELAEDLKYLRGATPLAWPISPSLGISAFFHDAEYHSAMKVEHQAVDIRALQGTKVRSAADGVVSKVVDNGFGYSYIIISHPEKIVTLYGHMSDMQVKEGQIVRQGEVIGLSGAMPGTKGAGWLTTGPHLHFEVFKDFKHVDPLTLLPLEFLPKESLESKYVKRVVH